MPLGVQVVVPGEKGELNKVRSEFQLPDGVDVEDAIAVLEAEHTDCDIVVGSVPEPESDGISHSFEVGDYALDDTEPTPSPEANTVEVVELIDARADEFTVEETGKTVAEHNPYYPNDDPVVAGIYPNMGGDDKVWHFPETRLRDV